MTRAIARLLLPLALITASFPLMVSPALAAAGDLDPSFGTGGVVQTTIQSTSQGSSVAVQPDGKIVVAGNSSNGSNLDIAVARYTPTGILDTSFDGDGMVTTPVGSTLDAANAVAVQPDGKIVVAGYSSASVSDENFAVVRYTSTGALDTTFSGDGKLTTSFNTSSFEQAFGVAIQPDGKIVVAGAAGTSAFGLARYTSTGSPDGTFGFFGQVTTFVGVSSSAQAVVIQPDGKIIAAGSAFNGSDPDIALARYTTAGVLDATFDTDGLAFAGDPSSRELANGITLQSDGKILVAGSKGPDQFSSNLAVLRFSAGGAPDSSFGDQGAVVTNVGSQGTAAAVAVQADGKVVAGGTGDQRGAIVRYSKMGVLDPTFGSRGIAKAPACCDALGMALQGDGKVLLAGSGGVGAFRLARYLVDAPGVSIADTSIAEGDSGTVNATFTVSLVGGGTSDRVGVRYATVASSADENDFVPTSGLLTFSPGQLSKTVTVPVWGDVTDEPNERFYVRLSNPSGATLEDDLGAAVIMDNDPVPDILTSTPEVTEGNAGTTAAVFTLQLSNPSSDAILVDYHTADDSAQAGSDYQARSGTKVILAGRTTATISVPINGDTQEEFNESFFLVLVDPDGATLANPVVQADIIDDDRPTIAIDDVAMAEVDSGATKVYTFHVTLTHASVNTITVAYATANGTAIAPGDYASKSGTVSFAPGTVSKTVKVTVKGDNAVESDETFTVMLSNSTNAIVADDTGLGTILNDD